MLFQRSVLVSHKPIIIIRHNNYYQINTFNSCLMSALYTMGFFINYFIIIYFNCDYIGLQIAVTMATSPAETSMDQTMVAVATILVTIAIQIPRQIQMSTQRKPLHSFLHIHMVLRGKCIVHLYKGRDQTQNTT